MSLTKIIIHKCFNIERRYLFNHLPEKILLICNGETEANINPNIYSTTPNNKIKLTKKGKEEANEMSKKLQKIIKPKESLKFYISSYKRAIETYEEIEKELKKKKYIFKYQIEPLLKEQDFGMMSDINKEKREKRLFIGKFLEEKVDVMLIEELKNLKKNYAMKLSLEENIIKILFLLLILVF